MIILSCGHQVNDFDHVFNVTVKTTDRAGEKALAYMSVCGACEDRYRQAGDLLDNYQIAVSWLDQESW